jgi:hypothetical protein
MRSGDKDVADNNDRMWNLLSPVRIVNCLTDPTLLPKTSPVLNPVVSELFHCALCPDH